MLGEAVARQTLWQGTQARGLSTGRPAKLNTATRAGAAQQVKEARSPNRSPLSSASAALRCTGELRKHCEGSAAELAGHQG